MKKSKIGDNGYRLIEEYGCVVLMYKDWYILRFKDRKIELAEDINTKMLKTDDRGAVVISGKTF